MFTVANKSHLVGRWFAVHNDRDDEMKFDLTIVLNNFPMNSSFDTSDIVVIWTF